MFTYKSLGEEEYQNAFINKEFDLAYQPIMNFETDSFETFEAFIRWHNPVLGTMPPSMFMGNIEKFDLQEQMTQYIFDIAVEQILKNSRSGYGETGVSINLSLKEFYNPNTITQLHKAASRLPFPEFLGIEVTSKVLTVYEAQNAHTADPEYHPDDVPSEKETKYLDNVRKTVDQYNEIGVTLALDTTDYAIGGLIRADMLGFHAIKISANALQKALLKDSGLLEEYVQASKDFRISMITVGIENQSLFKIAYNHGLTYAQGLFLCPPLCLSDPKEFNNHLNKYFNTKKELLEMQNSTKSLHRIHNKMVSSENSHIDDVEEEVEQTQKINEKQENMSNNLLNQNTSLSRRFASKMPDNMQEQNMSGIIDKPDIDSITYDDVSPVLSSKKKISTDLSLDDVLSELEVDHSYLEKLEEKQSKPSQERKESEPLSSIKNSIASSALTSNRNPNMNRGFSFGRRKQQL